MDRIECLKWLMDESPSTTQQLMAWLQRAKCYTPEMKEHRDGVQIEENGIIVGLRQRTNLYNGDCLTIHVVQLLEKYRIKAGLNLFLNYAANLIRGTM